MTHKKVSNTSNSPTQSNFEKFYKKSETTCPEYVVLNEELNNDIMDLKSDTESKDAGVHLMSNWWEIQLYRGPLVNSLLEFRGKRGT